MTTIVYGVNWLSVPAEDSVITDVNISGINKSLDAASPVQFTAQVADADQMTIAEEAWEKSTYGEETPVKDIIKSTDAEADRYPIAGGNYWYSVELTAKDGYIFSDTFNNSDYEGNVSFVVDGKNYYGCTYVKDNGKTLVAWEFLSPVTAIDSTPSVTKIGDVDIEGVKFDYAPGDAPAASGRKLDPYDEYYDIEYEYWEQMEETSPGVTEPVAFWYSDPAKNAALPESKRITTFEEGGTYMYSVSLVARDNCEFSENSRVMVNGSFVDARNVINSTNRLFATAVRTIKPETIHSQAIDLIEINGASLSFSRRGQARLHRVRSRRRAVRLSARALGRGGRQIVDHLRRLLEQSRRGRNAHRYVQRKRDLHLRAVFQGERGLSLYAQHALEGQRQIRELHRQLHFRRRSRFHAHLLDHDRYRFDARSGRLSRHRRRGQRLDARQRTCAPLPRKRRF